MILIGIKVSEVVIGVMLASITILIAVIAYRKLLARLNKDEVVQADYCVLFGLETSPSKGEIEFYFTSKQPKHVKFEILDAQSNPLLTVLEKDFPANGNIIRWDSTSVQDGSYFYQLVTDNQKTMKKFEIKNN